MLPLLLIAGIASELVTVLWLRRSILTEKVARRGHHLTREYAIDPFEVHRVCEIMETDSAGLELTSLTAGSVTVIQDEVVRAAVAKLLATNLDRLPVVDSERPGEIVGYVDRASVLDAHRRWYDEEHLRERPSRFFRA